MMTEPRRLAADLPRGARHRGRRARRRRVRDGLLDSLGLVVLVVEIEERFGVGSRSRRSRSTSFAPCARSPGLSRRSGGVSAESDLRAWASVSTSSRAAPAGRSCRSGSSAAPRGLPARRQHVGGQRARERGAQLGGVTSGSSGTYAQQIAVRLEALCLDRDDGGLLSSPSALSAASISPSSIR